VAPIGDGKTCIRRECSAAAVEFVGCVYPLVYAGHWPTGNPWTALEIDVTRYAIVAHTIHELEDSAKKTDGKR